MKIERPADVPTVAEAMAACVQKTAYMLAGPPGLFEPGPHGVPCVRKNMTPAERDAAMAWVLHDQTEEVLEAYGKLGEAMAWERERRVLEAILR